MRVFGFEFALNCFIEVDQNNITDMKVMSELIEQAENGSVSALARLLELSRETKSEAKLTTRNFHAPRLQGQ